MSVGIIAFAVNPLIEAKQEKHNVLFIAVDDLRPNLNCYGATHMHTPNLDRLASHGVVFERAYCQQAVSAPSRNSVLTGMRPDALGIYDLSTFFRTKVPDVVTLPQYFKQHGYHSEGIGKIFHVGHGNHDDPDSWSVTGNTREDIIEEMKKRQEIVIRGDTVNVSSPFSISINGKPLPYYCTDSPEENMLDAEIARKAIEKINALKDTTFFLAVGFFKPHLGFIAPRKYWDLYDPSQIVIPEKEVPLGMPDIALANFGELRKYYNIPQSGPLDDETSRNLIHGYYACVSMIDAQVGKLLDALEKAGVMENTIIVLWGDHGWKLGEYGSWCKHSNAELDVNAPLIISAPGMKKGVHTKSLVEFVDMYPTLCELAGLQKPAHLEGTSLVPILKNPRAEVKKVAISQYPRGKKLGYDNKEELMGYSIRTGKYRYTRWQKYENPSEIVAIELYDHTNSKVASENFAIYPKYKKKIDKMNKLMNNELNKYRLLKPKLPME